MYPTALQTPNGIAQHTIPYTSQPPMYWTTPSPHAPNHLLPYPLNTPLPTSPTSYLRALSALLTLINPLSAALIPLFRTYTILQSTSFSTTTTTITTSSPFSLLTAYASPYDDTASVLQALHAYICQLVQEIQDHYGEFCALYGWVGVGDLVAMVGDMQEEGEGEEEMERCWEVVRAWDGLGYLVEGEGVRRFCGEGVRWWDREGGDGDEEEEMEEDDGMEEEEEEGEEDREDGGLYGS